MIDPVHLLFVAGCTDDSNDRHSTMLRTAMITFRYQMRLLLREPVWIVIVMIQPLLYLALAVGSALLPGRGIPDRLAGTWLVPR